MVQKPGQYPSFIDSSSFGMVLSPICDWNDAINVKVELDCLVLELSNDSSLESDVHIKNIKDKVN